VKSESLVIAHHKGAVNVPTSLVHTARHAMEVGGFSGFLMFIEFDQTVCGPKFTP